MISSTVKQIDTIDCELSIYRKGCISIHVDLINSLVTWRESKQWCNSFTRTVSEAAKHELLTFIHSSLLLKDILESPEQSDQKIDMLCQLETKHTQTGTQPDDINEIVKNASGPGETGQTACLIPQGTADEYFDPSEWYQYVDQKKSSWQIVMTTDDKKYSQSGKFPLPKGWSDFQRILEKVSHAPFRLF